MRRLFIDHNFTAANAIGEGPIPSFSWLKVPGAPEGAAHLAINFNDGKPGDIAILESYNPIPKQANEREEDIDHCIFKGKLVNESSVHVSLTGGCPFEDSFEVSFEIFVASAVHQFAPQLYEYHYT